MNEQQQREGAATAPVSTTSGGRGMHDEVFGTDRRPFDDRADATFTFCTPELDEALAAVEYEIRFGKGAALIVGEAGLGKTQFVRTMLPRLSAKDHAVVLTWPASGKRDVVREACKAFGVSVTSSRGADARRLTRLERHLARHAHADSRNILFIDQAENLSSDHLTQIAALTELESDGTRLLSIVLTAQQRLLTLLDQPEHARLKQRLFGERVLPCLTKTQTAQYVRHRLAKSGHDDPDIFDADSIAWIHNRARGVPRLINHLCNQAILAAYGADESRITLATLSGLSEPESTIERSMDVEALGLPGVQAPFESGVTTRRTTQDGSNSIAGCWGDAYDDAFGEAAPSTTSLCDMGAVNEPSGGVSEMLASIDFLTDSQDQAVLGSMDSLFVRGEALLDRLERALARADRMAVSSESVHARNKAVETHLESLTRRAERLIDSFKRTTPETLRSLSSAAKQVQAIDQARAGAERVETKLIAVARTIAEKADDAQDRLAKLMQGLASGQSVEARLTELTTKASETSGDVDARTEALATLIRQADQHTARIKQALKGDDAAALEGRIKTCTESGVESVAAIEARVSRAQDSIAEAGRQFDQFEQTCRDRVLAICQSTIEERRAAFQRALHEVAETSKRQVDDACARASSFVADTESRVGSLRSTWQKTISTSDDQVRAVTRHTEALEPRVTKLQTIVESITQCIDDTTERLTASSRSGEKVIEAMSTERGRSEEIRRSLNATLTDIDKSVHQAREVCEQTDKCARLAEALATQNEAGDTTLHALAAATAKAGQAQDQLKSMLDLSQDQTRRLDSHNAAATSTLKELATATIEGRGAIKSLRSLSDTTKESIARGQAQVEMLTAGEADRKDTTRRLGLLVQAAHRLDASLRGGLDRASERLASLVSTTATADNTNEKIAGAVTTGQELIDRAESATRQCERSANEQMEKVDRLVQELQSLTGKADSTGSRLNADLDRAESVSASLSEGVLPAEKTREALTEVVEQASAQVATLVNHEQRATHLVEQLATMNETLESVRDTHDGMKLLVDESRALCGSLSTAGVDAQQQRTALAELEQAAEELTRTQTALNDEGNSLVKTLIEQLEMARTCAESSESVLVAFIERAEAIEKQLADSEARAQSIHESLHNVSDKPERLMKQADEQANKLTRVTDAVRKVSTGLAQTTLEAKRHLDALEQVNRESAERLAAVASLTNTTRLATQTLQTWMTESSSVQNRMGLLTGNQAGLGTEPARDSNPDRPRVANPRPIGETTGMGELAKLPSKTGNPATIATTQKQTGGKPLPVGATPRSAASANEIARLIDESKRAGVTSTAKA